MSVVHEVITPSFKRYRKCIRQKLTVAGTVLELIFTIAPDSLLIHSNKNRIEPNFAANVNKVFNVSFKRLNNITFDKC